MRSPPCPPRSARPTTVPPLALPRAKADGTPDEPTKLGEYLRISEAKLNALPKEVFLELRDKGVTAVMHAHLLSLGLWPKILSRAAVSGWRYTPASTKWLPTW